MAPLTRLRMGVCLLLAWSALVLPATALPAAATTAASAAALCDYDGDGRSDLAVWRPSNGTWYLRGVATAVWGQSGDVPVAGDYDGSGTSDLAVWRPSNGTWYVRGVAPVQWGVKGDIPAPGDYDGNGTSDLAVYRPSTQTWYVRGVATTQWGVAGDVPVAGDYDGNGISELAVWRPSTGTWYVRGRAATQYGIAGDVPVRGDYDGNGTTDFAVWRPSSGMWYVHGIATVQWGVTGDVPARGDYDGNGRSDFAVWRPSNGTWYVRGAASTWWGVKGDVLPAVGAGSSPTHAAPPYFPTRLTHVSDARQLVVVTGTSWSSSYATLRTYSRTADGIWSAVLPAMPARSGKAGWVWGGQRVQNSGTSPAGTYGLTTAFGLAGNPGTRLSYRHADSDDYMAGDPSDPGTYDVYQTGVSATRTWSTGTATSERVGAYPVQYRYGAIIDFNRPVGTTVHWSTAHSEYVTSAPVNTRLGFAIYLHISGAGATAGCVSVSQSNVVQILRWLDPALHPRIVMAPLSAIATA